jgi:hypothetical protein
MWQDSRTEDHVSTKLADVSFTDPKSTAGLHLLKLCLSRIMLRFLSDGVTTIKPGQQTNGNARMMWSDDSSFTLFPTSGRVYI